MDTAIAERHSTASCRDSRSRSRSATHARGQDRSAAVPRPGYGQDVRACSRTQSGLVQRYLHATTLRPGSGGYVNWQPVLPGSFGSRLLGHPPGCLPRPPVLNRRDLPNAVHVRGAPDRRSRRIRSPGTHHRWTGPTVRMPSNPLRCTGLTGNQRGHRVTLGIDRVWLERSFGGRRGGPCPA
jgi:hypothetical protein